MSNEKARLSASLLGTAPPFIHTLLYLCDKPRTITNLSSMRLTPGTRRITSPALESCVFSISCAETLLTITSLFFTCCTAATSVFLRSMATIDTSPN